jgi:hypothetical protein
MPSTPNKLLATVLAMILVCVPLGNAVGAGDACEGTGVAMTQMDHGQHLESSQTVTRDMKGSEGSSACLCCADHACSVCACGTAVALGSYLSVQPERMHGILNDVSGDRESSDRQTPPFKPPRV